MAGHGGSTAPARRSGAAPAGAGRDLLALTALTVALRLPAFVADRHLTFDDGVYGASAVAMRAGGQPFRDVFSSQGPLFLPVVWLGDLLGLRTANAPRVAAVASGVALVAFVYLAARRIADRAGALLAAGLTTACASVLWVTGPLAADGVGLAFAVLTILLVMAWREEVTVRRGVCLGLAVSATLSVKALLAPVVLPVVLIMVAGRRVRPILAGAITAVAVHLALWLPWGPANVWDQSYRYHLEVATDRTPGANLAKILRTLVDRDLPVVIVVAVVLLAIALRRRATGRESSPRLVSPDLLLLAWLGATVVVLLTEQPMWRPHVSQLVPPLALLAARHRPPVRWLAVALLVVLPYHLDHAWGVLHPSGYGERSSGFVHQLRALPEGALAISDDPGIVWRAGRRTPPDLVDASILRMETHRITAGSIARAARDDAVCAVVVTSTVRWGSFPDLPRRLAQAGYEVVAGVDRASRVYRKSDCSPS